jgi:hypothetical protein
MRDIDRKYATTGDIIRKLDNSVLPPDEPLILFRGRDRLLPQMLDYYMSLKVEVGSTKERFNVLQSDIDAIKQWQNSHPDRLRTPK